MNTIDVKDSTGAPVNTSSVVPRYWEAWAVNATGQISPSITAVHDMWIRPNWGANTVGHWSMSGRLHFTTTDPATQGFTAGGVSNAGILLSTATAPSGLRAVPSLAVRQRAVGQHGRHHEAQHGDLGLAPTIMGVGDLVGTVANPGRSRQGTG